MPPSCHHQSIIHIGSQTSESQQQQKQQEQCPSVSRCPEEYHCRRRAATKGSCEVVAEAQGRQSRQYGRERAEQQALCSNGVSAGLFGFICVRNVAAAVCRVGFEPFFFFFCSPSLSFPQPFFFFFPYLQSEIL